MSNKYNEYSQTHTADRDDLEYPYNTKESIIRNKDNIEKLQEYACGELLENDWDIAFNKAIGIDGNFNVYQLLDDCLTETCANFDIDKKLWLQKDGDGFIETFIDKVVVDGVSQRVKHEGNNIANWILENKLYNEEKSNDK